MKKNNSVLGMLLLLAVVSSCKKLDLVPTDKYTEKNYWTSEEKANQVVSMAYSQMVNPSYFFYNNVLSDDAYDGRGDAEGTTSISSGVYDPSLGRLDAEWRFHYQGIKTCNTLLKYVDGVPKLSDAIKNRMKAEMLFIRAKHFFNLTTWWGAVPLFTEDISIDQSEQITRSSHEEVIKQVLADLDKAESMLPTNTQYKDADKGRITKGACIALKARVYLYDNNWEGVTKECAKLMGTTDNGSYQLFGSYSGLFDIANENNSEVILGYGYAPEIRTHSEMIDMVPISVGARLNALAPTQSLVDDYLMSNGKDKLASGSGFNANDPYNDRDPRLTATIVYDGYQWTKPDGSIKTIYIKPGTDPDKENAPDEYKPGQVSSPTGYYVRKYYDPTANNFASGLDLIVLRYADVLLMDAEAKNELSKLSSDDWNKTIKLIRIRAGFTAPGALDYNSSWSQDDLRQIIRRERRVELALEGTRIFDIRRWKTAQSVLNGYVHGARFGDPGVDGGYVRVIERSFNPTRHYLWPVPREERALNTNLTQNAGW